jgi:uncharacterized membrane protein/predicted DsbA family dithiol-disulfide isomerase
MTAKTRKWLLALAALGLGASAWSTWVHHTLLTTPGAASFCDINSTVSCTQAYLSQYGSLWGVPVAVLGVLFFAVVLLVVGLAGRLPVQSRETVPAYVFAMSTVGLAFVMYLAWASFFQIGAVCLLCVVTYVAVIGIFIVSGGAASAPMSSLPSRAARDAASLVKSPLALALTVALAVAAALMLNAFPSAPGGVAAQSRPEPPGLTDQQRFEFVRWLNVQPRENVPVEANGARVVIVKFNDYQCPACREAFYNYKGLEARYEATGDVRFELRHFPLEAECNPSVPGGTHLAACEAAAAVVMAEENGTADKLEEWLFANLQTLTPDAVRKGAAEIGGIQDFDARYGAALARVRADAELGTKLGVNSTPTFFINGVKIAGVLPPAAFQLAVEHELNRQP